jgi:hypothetical protein
MSFADLQYAPHSLTTPPGGLLHSRSGGGRAAGRGPSFRLNPSSEGCRPEVPAQLAGVFGWPSGERSGPCALSDLPGRLRQGAQSNFGRVPASENLHLCSYRASTRPPPTWRPDKPCGPSTDRHRCPAEETKKREFRRQAPISAEYLLARTGVCWELIDFV